MAACLVPMPIAWIVVETLDGHYVETASSFYNGCGDGGKFEEMPSGPRRTPYSPALAVGLPDDEIAAHIRARKELVLHTSTLTHSRRIQQLLQGPPKNIELEELAQGLGVDSVRRVASAPIAFSCKVLKELQTIGQGRTAFILQIVGVQVHRSIIIDSGICSKSLKAVAARDFCGTFLFAAREEHTMLFPEHLDDEGRIIVEDSFATKHKEGTCWDEEFLEYEPPLLPPLPYNPLKALIVPRPIGWISTRGSYGDNLSPYSFFGYLSDDVVFFGSGGHHSDGGGEKDALRDARETGEFCVNAVPWDLRLIMSASAAEAAKDVDEFELVVAPDCFKGASISKAMCKTIAVPYVANAELHLECKVIDLVVLDHDDHAVVVIGRVVCAEGNLEHIPVATRGGYMNYFRIGQEHISHESSNAA